MRSDFLELEVSAPEAAKRLLGCLLEREIEGRRVLCKIVEVEAYDQTDAASHSYRGKTPRTEIMFGRAGYLYVYFTYGMHYCCNVVTGVEGEGSAVLIRAVEPIEGVDIVESRRHKSGKEATNGPAKICQALGINREMNGHYLKNAPLKLIMKPPVKPQNIVVTPRIGIKKAIEKPWRFYLRDSTYTPDA